MNNRIGRKLVIDHNILYQLLLDELIWELVPEIGYLKEELENSHHFALERLLKPREVSSGCSGCTSLKTSMRPAMQAIGCFVADAQKNEPERLHNLITFITQKKGERPSPIVIRYKDADGKITALEF